MILVLMISFASGCHTSCFPEPPLLVRYENVEDLGLLLISAHRGAVGAHPVRMPYGL
jgi:hypothetical protein